MNDSACLPAARDRRNHERANAASTLAGMDSPGQQPAKKAKRRGEPRRQDLLNMLTAALATAPLRSHCVVTPVDKEGFTAPTLQPSVTAICRLGADFTCSNDEHSLVVGRPHSMSLHRLEPCALLVAPRAAFITRTRAGVRPSQF